MLAYQPPTLEGVMYAQSLVWITFMMGGGRFLAVDLVLLIDRAVKRQGPYLEIVPILTKITALPLEFKLLLGTSGFLVAHILVLSSRAMFLHSIMIIISARV